MRNIVAHHTGKPPTMVTRELLKQALDISVCKPNTLSIGEALYMYGSLSVQIGKSVCELPWNQCWKIYCWTGGHPKKIRAVRRAVSHPLYSL